MSIQSRFAPCLAAAVCCVFLSSARADVTVRQWTKPGEEVPPKAWQSISMKSGAKSFMVRLKDGAVGLGPKMENWYGGGFLLITCGESREATSPARMALVRAEPEVAEVHVTWQMKDGPVVARFVFRDGEDKLWLTVKMPKAEKRSVRLRCYPSSFAGGWKQGEKIRKRHTVTAKQDLIIGEKRRFKVTHGPDEPWVLSMDDHFDVAQKRGVGPCAALFFREELSKAQSDIGHYSVDLTLTPKPDVEEIHIVLWDFIGVTNADAVTYMKSPGITPERLAAARP